MILDRLELEVLIAMIRPMIAICRIDRITTMGRIRELADMPPIFLPVFAI